MKSRHILRNKYIKIFKYGRKKILGEIYKNKDYNIDR